MPEELTPIDFGTLEVMETPVCEALIDDSKSFWESLPEEPSEGVCQSWQTPVLSYVSREIDKTHNHLSFTQLFLEENTQLKTLFDEIESGERVFTGDILERLNSMAVSDGFDVEGWLYDGVWILQENALLSAEEMSSFVSKVASCSSQEPELLESALVNLCRIVATEAEELQSTDQKLSAVIDFYGNTLVDDEMPHWEELVCDIGGESASEGSGTCPVIEEHTFQFFEESLERFKVAGACESDLYEFEVNNLCGVLKIIGLESSACDNYKPITFQAKCHE